MDVKPKLTEKGQRDYQLIQRALEYNDQQAYTNLVHYYREAVYYLMLKMTSSPTDAEDLTIEAFGRAFKNLTQYSPNYGFSTWLFRIAVNNCIDFQRRNRLQTSSLHEESYYPYIGASVVQLADTTPNPEDILIKAQKVETMRQIVEKLKPHYRTIVQMRYFDELSYEEIAQKMNLPLGTVKAQLFRSRELLYNILRKRTDKI
ncbi:MAG: sigma-70 family RNA polymerase sigma factor [Bacteroidales bacterium]|jgi:RNA polymerase sigma factor (sigma-70 family)|nr:sigma-70 family RNA polymerase sigma factor [Bacteroidales bacterium]MDD3701233.1 sigma-70 family RNA polymerase sigma factor [Bacteroidales bacterium]MDY0368363.1 sigma-70 family RNA polymerase sigma factor [Bacteroidales bacterium]